MVRSIVFFLSLCAFPGMISAYKSSSSNGKYIIELGNSPDIDSCKYLVPRACGNTKSLPTLLTYIDIESTDIGKIFGTLQAATPIPINNTVQLLSYSDTTKKNSDESVELLQNVSIGDFRAVTVSAHSLDILQKLVKDHPDVLSIVPDVDLTFDLPKPTAIGSDYTKRSLTPVIECSRFKRP